MFNKDSAVCFTGGFSMLRWKHKMFGTQTAEPTTHLSFGVAFRDGMHNVMCFLRTYHPAKFKAAPSISSGLYNRWWNFWFFLTAIWLPIFLILLLFWQHAMMLEMPYSLWNIRVIKWGRIPHTGDTSQLSPSIWNVSIGIRCTLTLQVTWPVFLQVVWVLLLKMWATQLNGHWDIAP